MKNIIYRIVPEVKIDSKRTKMAVLEVLSETGEVLNSMTMSRVFKNYDYSDTAKRLYIEYQLQKKYGV
jgi:hypothetical protein